MRLYANRLGQRRSLFNRDMLPFVLLMPTVFVVLIVMIIPLFYGIFLSLFDYRIGTELTMDRFVGLDNFIRLFGDRVFIQSLINTVIFAIFATSGTLVIGTLVAVLLLRLKPRLSAILRGICAMPLLVSPIITGLIWRYMYDPTFGFVYWILGLFGITIHQFPGITMPSTALMSVIFVHWWQITPFVLLVVSSSLVSIPAERYEAASIDGAGSVRQFFNISLPALKDVYFMILIISGVDTVKVFDVIFALTRGGPANSTISMSVYAHRQAFEMFNMGYAMAISIMVMLTGLVLFGIPFIRYNQKRED